MSRPLVLISDDSPDDLLFCEAALLRHGVDVDIRIVAENEEASQWLKRIGQYDDQESFPTPDILILDLKAGALDGKDLLQWIRSTPAYDGLAVIIHTGMAQPGDDAICRKLGATDFITKEPWCLALVQSIERLLVIA